jgi:hypothetical protein
LRWTVSKILKILKITYRCDDTRDCIIQFCPPDDEHMCSKHVEAWNKLINLCRGRPPIGVMIPETIIQFCPPDDEHMCSKQVEAWNKLLINLCTGRPPIGVMIPETIIQFCPPDDEHVCSKHVEAWNKLIIKYSASSWLILRNKYIEMHGQQNIKKY